ncbi:hypothetical protein B005_5416 [Nocardiopsis alba ATCC BAA-2165]|uniref:Uncharacterized protein n=1 Tax=Nocardiopsis alba (strain ATCC BAA-2165 / BE74) TaxID=1205910 RepID=J7L2A9_NOCAA|nr:hypothetical protein B005_5416 [Nocardiopsis alba ATCC BAA-2165]
MVGGRVLRVTLRAQPPTAPNLPAFTCRPYCSRTCHRGGRACHIDLCQGGDAGHGTRSVRPEVDGEC